MSASPQHPFHPIIYVRGFAATQGEIEETVADPYMGFNIGSTKARRVWTGEIKRFFFESPLVRLMNDHGYSDVFEDGEDLVDSDRPGRSGTTRPPDRRRSPHLFSVFLDPSKSVKVSGSVSFAFDLKILVPDYEVDGVLFMKRHYEGGYILRQQILVEAFLDDSAPTGWRIKYGYQEDNPGRPGKDAPTHSLADGAGLTFDIELAQRTRPGVIGRLRVEARPWN